MLRTSSAATAVADAPQIIRISDVIAGLSHALDLTEGHPEGHTARSCLIGLRLAGLLQLPDTEQADLFYALLLKDAGCSSNAARVHQLFGGDDQTAKRAVWLRDWRLWRHKAAYALAYAGRGERWWPRLMRFGRLAAAGPAAERELFQIRCDRGAAIALDLGLSQQTASAIRSMDEHWDGGGHPDGLRGDRIPIAARIIGLAQVLEIFAGEFGRGAALDVVTRRAGRWFDPELAAAAIALGRDDAFWHELRTADPRALVARAEPRQAAIVASEARLEGIAEGFASVIDAKSPYTCDHSRRVAGHAVTIGARLGLASALCVRLRRAALLHDIGKLGVPNSILDKPGPLTPEEWQVVHRHPRHTFTILEAVPVFREFAFDASCHHEKLNGTGYHAGLRGHELSVTARVLAVADMTDALLADRPYRRGLPAGEVLRILDEERRSGALWGPAVEALAESLQ